MKHSKLLYSTLALFMLASPVLAGIDDGVVADYPFNGDMLDESGNGYDGQVPSYCNTPTLTEDRYGNPDSAFTFNQACIEIGPGGSQGLPSWGSYSVSAWFLNDGSDEGRGYGQKLIDQTTWYSDFYISVQNTSDGRLSFVTYTPYDGQGLVDPADYGDNQWHHVVVTKSGTHAELWIDGTLKDTTDDIKTVTNSQPLLLGYSVSGDGFQRKYWSGKIDDIRVYDRTLTDAEIGGLYFDVDGDGVTDGADLCPSTPLGAPVDSVGCADLEVDQDADGVCDPGAPSAGPSECIGSDNCPTVFNPDQTDINGDGYGDICVSPDVYIPPDATIGFGVLIGTGSSIGSGAVIGDNVELANNVTIDDLVTVGEGTIMGSGTWVKASAAVGANVEIGPNVTIGKASVIGDATIVGEGTLLRSDVTVGAAVTLGTNVTLAADVEVGDRAIIGDRTKIGALTQIGVDTTIGTDTQIGRVVVVGNNVTIGNFVIVKNRAFIPNGAVIPDGATVP